MITIGKYRFFSNFLFILFFVVFLFGLPRSAEAIKIIRDAQFDSFMVDISKELFEAANLEIEDFDIYVYDSSSYNAFVSSYGVFISTSLLLEANSPNEVAGVIAHELGHLDAGHLTLLKHRLLENRLDVFNSFLLGFGAAAIIGLAGGDIEAASGLGIGLASLGTNASNKNFFSFRQNQEAIADIIAFELLSKTRQSAKGLIKILEFLQKKSNLSFRKSRYNYAHTHPATSDRIKNLRIKAEKTPFYHKLDTDENISNFNLLKAKIAGFSTENIYQKFLDNNAYQQKDKNFAKAINLYTKSKLQEAIKIILNILTKQPKNPFINEFYGQMLLESGDFSGSLPYFEKAVQYAPDTSFNRIIYSKALLNSNEKKHLQKATQQLKHANLINKRMPVIYYLLAQTYAKLKDEALAELFTAYAKLYQKKNADSQIHLRKAKKLLEKTKRQNTQYWLLAYDLEKKIKEK